MRTNAGTSFDLENLNKYTEIGKIISLKDGRSDPRIDRLEGIVQAVMQTDKEQRIIDIPISISSDFELMPYQLALVGSEVKYSKAFGADENAATEDGFWAEWELEIL